MVGGEQIIDPSSFMDVSGFFFGHRWKKKGK
jgi:hypothetical protein